MSGRGVRRTGTLLLSLGLAVAAACSGAEEKKPETAVQVWVTMPDKSLLLERQEDVSFGRAADPETLTVAVDDGVRYQRMEGFGASLTDSSAWLIANRLSERQREELMKLLFDHEAGIGISYLRLPMGASDFALGLYSYNDMPQGEADPELSRFSIEHDRAYVVPLLKQALAINPELSLMASPWSPPGWMKTSDSLIGGNLRPDSYEAFARYFVKFLEAYRDEGVPIGAITLQNEPHHVPSDYPGMRMNAEEQTLLVKKHVGPALREAGLATDIVIWDHNWDETYYPLAVLNDPEAKEFVAGTAFHGYAGQVEAQSRLHEAHPDKGIYFTESSGGEWATDFGANVRWDMQTLIIGATRNWAKTVLKWNLALDENHGPKLGGCQDCRGVVTIGQSTGEATLNEEYYAFGHASKFVRAGAYRIESDSHGNESIETTAFLNPDGSLVLIALNSSAVSLDFQVKWRERAYAYTLPAGAAATFVWHSA